jgi:short-subunit dehydrogenase
MEFARLGADVTLVERNEEALERVRAELPSSVNVHRTY